LRPTVADRIDNHLLRLSKHRHLWALASFSYQIGDCIARRCNFRRGAKEIAELSASISARQSGSAAKARAE